MRDGGEGVLVGIVILALILATTGTPSIQDFERDGTITCREVSGEIIEKEAPVTIIVTVNDQVSNEIKTYNVYVSPEAYSNYSIGDTHIEQICTLTDYEYYKEIIDALLESGILD
tara:strand:+ start:431 stop:775 length:345 start_codon:yes stop_codon:yes gene_type:complete